MLKAGQSVTAACGDRRAKRGGAEHSLQPDSSATALLWDLGEGQDFPEPQFLHL